MKVLCFNGATTFQLWKSNKDTMILFEYFMLQWGHNFSVMEILKTDNTDTDKTDASMGPQLFSYGNNKDA